MKKELYILTLTLLLVSTVSAFEFCEDGNMGEENLRIISVDDMIQENTKEWVWKNNQDIEIEVRVQNRDDKEKDYTLELIFMDGNDEIEIAKDSEDLKKEIKLGAEKRESVVFKFDTEKEVEEGEYDLFVKFYKSGDEDEECVENSEIEIEMTEIKICTEGEVSDKKLEIKKINDYTKNIDKEWTWAPGREVKVSVEVRNKDYSKREFEVELMFLDEEGNIVDIVERANDLKEETVLEEDEENEVAFDFELKTDIEEEYFLYAKAYDGTDEKICTSLQAESDSDPVKIEIEIEDVDVQIKDVSGPSVLEKGIINQYTVEVMNLGSEDQEKVNVILFNSRLNLKEEKTISNLESGKTKSTTFNFQISEDVNYSQGKLLFTLEFDYNSDKDFYRESLDEEDDFEMTVDLVEKTSTSTPQEETEKINESINQTKDSNETIESINETQEIEFNTTNDSFETLVTGNVVGESSNESSSTGFYVFLTIIFASGIFFVFKKTGKTKTKKIKEHHPKEYIEVPFTTRRYTASLHSNED